MGTPMGRAGTAGKELARGGEGPFVTGAGEVRIRFEGPAPALGECGPP